MDFVTRPAVRRVLLGSLLALLLASIYLHGSAGFYDHDEIGHYVSLKSMTADMWFGPWQRAGFKLIYLPLKHVDLEVLRVINVLMIAACSALLYRIAGLFVAFVFLTFPFIHQIGGRFYSEVPAMLLITLSLVLLQKRRLAWFALVLSYAVLVRFEMALLFLPAAYVLRKHPRNVPLLFVVPATFYLASVAVSGDWTYLFARYAGYTHEHSWKSSDPFHYLRAVFVMGGVWPLLALPTLVARLRRGDDLTRFMGVSTITLLLLYSLSYWEKTAFGPIIGIERHILLTAPMVAVFAGTARTPYRRPLAPVAVLLLLLVPFKEPGAEEQTLDPACEAIGEIAHERLFVEHGYVNFRLGAPLHADTITTLQFREEAEPGDLLLWENHYAVRLVELDELTKEWTPVWKASTGGFDVYLLQKL